MKRSFLIVLAALCTLSSIFAGGASEGTEIVSTDGSTSMEEVIGSLAEAFMMEHSDITVTYNPTGSSSGISAVLEGRADIGLSSRALRDSEVKSGLTGTTLALDGIAIIVNPENPVSSLTLEEIASVYKGEITNWSALGGLDAPIVLIGREAGSGTRDGFETITGTAGVCKYRQELTSTGDVITTVSANPNAIGYASLASVSERVKTLKVNGVMPSKESIQKGEYLLQRPFVLVTSTDKALTGAAGMFFDYITGSASGAIIEGAGAVPVN